MKISIVFDDVIADRLSNKKRNPTVTELVTRRRKLNISLIFITQYYFLVPVKFQTKFILSHYGNLRQKQASTNCI